MDFQTQDLDAFGKKITLIENGQEVGRASLYVLKNSLHNQPFGLIEDVFVAEEKRGQGVGSKILREIVAEAKQQGCYKLIANSRHANIQAHKFYEKTGFKKHGFEFRMDL